jgi:hypothetical protein
VVGDRDGAEPLRLGVVKKISDRHRAVVGVLGVHMEVADDERPVRHVPSGRRAAARDDMRVDVAFERVRQGFERVGAPRFRGPLGLLAAPRAVVRESRECGGDELGLRGRARRVDNRDA